MSYHVVDPDGLDPTPDHPCDRRSITESVGLETLAAAVYRLSPGEQLPRSYHYHEQREELFSVRTGTLFVETPENTYEVEPDEVFVVEPDSPHRAFNPADAAEVVRVLGIGAPRYDLARAYAPETDEESGT